MVALALDAQAAALLLHFDRGHSVVARQWGLDTRESPRYEKHYYTVDIWAKVARNASNWIGPSERLVPFSDLKRTEFYNDFLCVQGISHGLFTVLEQARRQLASLSIFRGAQMGPFEEEELAFVNFLTPHIKRAYRLHSELAVARGKSTGLLGALDLISTAIILVGSRMQVIVMNRAAKAFTKSNSGLQVGLDGLRAERAAESAQLQRLIAVAVATSNGNGLDSAGAMKISRHELPPLQILVSPFRDKHPDNLDSPRAIIFINDPARRVRPPQDTLRVMFGLTPAESRLSLLITDGKTPSDIAEELGLSQNTLKSQLSSIYRKMGIARQSQLVRLVLQLSASTSASRPGDVSDDLET